ncbi:MAG: hypothetical protein WCI57_01270 [Candidatus Berkelbacteria bacterium]
MSQKDDRSGILKLLLILTVVFVLCAVFGAAYDAKAASAKKLAFESENATQFAGPNFTKMSEDTYVWKLRLTDKREIVSTFEQDMATFDRECPNRQIIGWTIVERYTPMSTADICPPVPPEKPAKPIPSVVWITTRKK